MNALQDAPLAPLDFVIAGRRARRFKDAAHGRALHLHCEELLEDRAWMQAEHRCHGPRRDGAEQLEMPLREQAQGFVCGNGSQGTGNRERGTADGASLRFAAQWQIMCVRRAFGLR